MVYSWKINGFCKADPNEVGELFEKVEKENGELTPKGVVDASREEGSLLHDCFEWDDKKAAESYREVQASTIIRNLAVEVEVEEKHPVRAYFNIERGSKVYENINVIMGDDAKREKLLRTAFSELSVFKVKYRTLKELEPLFEVIDKIKEAI